MSGPTFTPSVPTGSSFQRWTPTTAATPSIAPAATIACAPPSPSSAGWNSTRTVMGAPRPAVRRAAAAPMATWPSWPQACITPGTSEA